MKFKAPTIKDYGRAYVRLYKSVSSQGAWQDFLAAFDVRHVPHGMVRNGDCAVQVFIKGTLQPAVLGLTVPYHVRYHYVVEPGNEVWNEYFTDGQRNLLRTTLDGRMTEKIISN